MHITHLIRPLVLMLVITLMSCDRDTQWKGQGAIRKVNTETVPIQHQLKGEFNLGNGVYYSNDFSGARMNGAILTGDTMVTLLITPENTPINESPWYAFKIWADAVRQIKIRLTYQDGVKHRYYPKLSYDGEGWFNLDSSRFTLEGITFMEEEGREMADRLTMNLEIGPDTLWISAQELITSQVTYRWIDSLSSLPYVETAPIGQSKLGKPIKMMRIGQSDDSRMIMIISRQHPPEVTGYLAMKAFVEVIAGPSDEAIKFRERYNTYVIPLANPDGVDLGHWRHNAGGIDLNRDWQEFNQQEVGWIRNFMLDKIKGGNGEFIAALDFHSTWEDIYYTIDPELKGNFPGLIPELIERVGEKIEGYQPNIRASIDSEARISSTSFFFYQMGAESVTYEVGDNTPRDFVRQKGETTARELINILLEQSI